MPRRAGESSRPWDGAKITPGIGFYDTPGIATDDLRAEHVPSADSEYGIIAEFALSLDRVEYRGDLHDLGPWANRNGDVFRETGALAGGLSVDDLRALLFFEQRRFRHLDTDPEGGSRRYIEALLTAMRDRLEERDAR